MRDKTLSLLKLLPRCSIFLVLLIGGCASAPKGEWKPPVFPGPPEDPKIYWEQTIMTSNAVQSDDKGKAFMQALVGAQAGGFSMAKPFGISVHEGRVYVGDTASRRIHVFDFPEERYFTIGTEKPGLLGKPLGMDHDHEGNLYVVDGTFKVVQSYDRDGNHLLELGVPELFSKPSGLAVDPEGDKVYVVDTGGVSSEKHNMVVLDAKTGDHLYTFSERGKEDGELNLARDAVVTPQGIYVVDGGNFRVQQFSERGEFRGRFGTVGIRGGQFARPKGIDVDGEGRLYVSDAAFGNFQIFDREGRLLLAVGSRSQRGGPAKFMLPAGIAVDEDGRIYMVDQYFRKVDVFRPAWLAEDDGFLQKGSLLVKEQGQDKEK